MCGRYVQATPIGEVLELLGAKPAEGLIEGHEPSWNIPPTTAILGVALDRSGERRADRYRWGLVPPFASSVAVGSKAFNARAETVAATPMFRSAFRSKRLLLPADAYYEWQRSGQEKQAYLFRRRDGSQLIFAGVYELWREHEADEWTRSCTIITTSAGADIGEVHNRMPVILEREDWRRWLEPDSDARSLQSMLHPAPAGTLLCQQVSSRVGSTANDDPDLALPLANVDGEIISSAGVAAAAPELG